MFCCVFYIVFSENKVSQYHNVEEVYVYGMMVSLARMSSLLPPKTSEITVSWYYQHVITAGLTSSLTLIFYRIPEGLMLTHAGTRRRAPRLSGRYPQITAPFRTFTT